MTFVVDCWVLLRYLRFTPVYLRYVTFTVYGSAVRCSYVCCFRVVTPGPHSFDFVPFPFVLLPVGTRAVRYIRYVYPRHDFIS